MPPSHPLRRAAAAALRGAAPTDPDHALLRRFVADRTDPAFAELVRRHGPMVLAACRRVLADHADAEDAFQATFLVLARRAGSVARTDNLAGWLYGVAVRTARGVRLMRDRRRKREAAWAGANPRTETTDAPAAEWAELAAAVDEELARLPDPFRLAVVLCELRGHSRREAAAELNIPEGTLSSRLAAAKRKLADRLARRGIAAPATAVAAVFARDAAARVPAEWIDAAAGGAASAAAVAAADGVVKALFAARLKATLAVGLSALVVVAASVGFGNAPGPAAPRAVAAAPMPKSRPAPPPTDWPTPRGNPAQTAATADEIGELEVRWTVGTTEVIDGSPVVADGRVFVATAEKKLRALDLATGRTLWAAEIGETKASPGWHDGRVVVADRTGKVSAFDAASGKRVWDFSAGAEVTAAPNFHGGNVLIPAHDGKVFAVTAAAGKLVWVFDIGDAIHGSVAVVGDRVYVAGCDKHLRVVDAKTGVPTGRHDLGGQTAGWPAVAGGRAFVGTMNAEAVAVDLAAMGRAWTFKAAPPVNFGGPAAVTAETAVFRDERGRVWALDRATGRAKWDYTPGGGPLEGACAVAGDKVLAPAPDALDVLEIGTGRRAQRVRLKGDIYGTPAVAGGWVVVATDRGEVVGLGPKQ